MNQPQPVENMPKIAARLATLYKQRVTVAINLRTHQCLLEDRKLQIIPPEGWQGKNADERSISERRTYASDKAIMETTVAIGRYQVEIDKIDAEMNALEAERRAGEHTVYAMMADALSGIRNRSSAPATGRSAVQDAGKYAISLAVAEHIAQIVRDGGSVEVTGAVIFTEPERQGGQIELINIDPIDEMHRQINEGAGEQVIFQAGGYTPTEQTEQDDLPF